MLDLIRLANDRWLVRAAAAREDGTPVALEEILVCEGMPNIEAVIDLRDDQRFLVVRERHAHDHVLAERAIEKVSARRAARAAEAAAPAPAPLRVVWDASHWDAARAKPRTSPNGPIVPA